MDHKPLASALFPGPSPAPLGLMDDPNQHFQKLQLFFGFGDSQLFGVHINTHIFVPLLDNDSCFLSGLMLENGDRPTVTAIFFITALG